MRLLLIRHGDPDYANDTLTEKGVKEAKLLAERLAGENIRDIYVSPLGRAQRTAQETLEKLGRTAVTLDWLQEFTVSIYLPGEEKRHSIWDFMPSFLDKHRGLYSAEEWLNEPYIQNSEVPMRYAQVCSSLDSLLEEHGYRRKETYYEAVRANTDTLVFFCHLGLTGVLLSHLFHTSPVAILQSFAGTPTSVTEVVTEEREEGIVQFRANWLGDVSHLYKNGEKPAFRSAGYRETASSEGRK